VEWRPYLPGRSSPPLNHNTVWKRQCPDGRAIDCRVCRPLSGPANIRGGLGNLRSVRSALRPEQFPHRGRIANWDGDM
jgi:hypothetical protein